ncbi:MAG: Asp-tRNA(Asn)/Glu-tRNA(Gln) amidotransferase subunit GatB [Parcubacteria group bacterium]|nr:Asp-tRNA(Asn)/Glu-tRNA(Gln) amidotransferase subunit GatB [Parcubacteria group bacterium]
MNYVPAIGLEVHAELNTKSKMFCSSFNDPTEKEPNVNVCPVCLGHPGTLPVPNEEAIRKVLRVGLALNCTIAEYSKFDRKNYFYPDLPKGYQISQYDMPLCKGGFLQIGPRRINITRIHLEEDTAKLMHLFEPEGSSEPERPEGAARSLVDFNRAGVPLMELVTEPDITSAKEASAFAHELQILLRYLEVSDADMERGQMRVEANISLRLENSKSEIQNPKLGTKVEVKNLNSFRSVERAIAFEIERQKEILESGKRVAQETRGWDDKKGETYSQREKEEAHDYRYFPEPDIPLLSFSAAEISRLRADIPELPQARRVRLMEEYGLPLKEASFLVQERELGDYYEKTASEFKELGGTNLKLLCNYLVSDLLGQLQEGSVKDKESLVTPENFAELILLLEQQKITSRVAKQVLKMMFETGADPDHIIEESGFTKVWGSEEIARMAQAAVAANPKAVADFKKGKEATLQFLIGNMMVVSKGAIDPGTAEKALRRILTD